MKPQEQLTLEPYERDHAVVVGIYRWVFMYKPKRAMNIQTIKNKNKRMFCTIMWPIVWTAAYLDLKYNWVTSHCRLKCFLCSSVLQINLLYLFLQTTTQAEEMRVLSFFFTSSFAPEITASATRWTQSRWQKTDISEPFSCFHLDGSVSRSMAQATYCLWRVTLLLFFLLYDHLSCNILYWEMKFVFCL